jgi:hypothetical protein
MTDGYLRCWFYEEVTHQLIGSILKWVVTIKCFNLLQYVYKSVGLLSQEENVTIFTSKYMKLVEEYQELKKATRRLHLAILKSDSGASLTNCQRQGADPLTLLSNIHHFCTNFVSFQIDVIACPFQKS